MPIRPLPSVAALIVAGAMLLVAPATARASDGMTETGTTTYEVLPGQGQIQVTVKISIYNNTPNETTSGGIVYTTWNNTEVTVEQVAGPVSATSNAGNVSQSTVSSDDYYRVVKLNYPNVYYGETRVVTATYTIPATPQAGAIFRASQAYASLCAVGNGQDAGSVSVVVPDGYDLHVDVGGQLIRTGSSGGKQVFSSGAQTTPYEFWTCVEAENPANLTHTASTAAGQAFDIQGWPEDPAWTAAVGADLGGDVQRLEDLTGLSMPGGTISIAEIGAGHLNDNGVLYVSSAASVSIPESAGGSVVAHALAHVWFNQTLFKDTWVSEGLAGYGEMAAGEGNFAPCGEPGVYPGSGSPDLLTWQALNYNSATADHNVSDWQYAASCYFFTSIAGAMGPANFKNVLRAASADEMAYSGAAPGEKSAGARLPLTSEQMLDLLDERGMVPAGIADLDTAQDLLAPYGVFDSATLAARSSARSVYHALATSAGTWQLPLAIRGPMGAWDFPSAQAAMATARQIIDLRATIQKEPAGFSLDGTAIKAKFEAAATQADLGGVLTLIKAEADATAKLDLGSKLLDSDHTVLQTLGLLGTDLGTVLKGARTDLERISPDLAGPEAQSVIDRVNGSGGQGLLRVGVVGGSLALFLLGMALIVFDRRRRSAVVATHPGIVSSPTPPGGPDPAAGEAAPADPAVPDLNT